MRLCACTGCAHCGNRCAALGRGTRCEGCRKEKRRREDRRRPNSRQRGYGAKWQRTRAAYLAQYGWCEEPGCQEKATDVHHVDGLGPKGPQGHDWSNLMSLCKPHHDRLTSQLQPGGFRA